ncbi:hypothetical protein FQN54_008803 [Arachnomyces sp. PD_36]|nr:hypothetical protein FQN54_008803 [Arachnomyces sp. PD_36]
MSGNPAATDAALTCIATAKLTPTEHLLLKDLVESAVDPDGMARRVLQTVEEDSSRSTEESLRLLKEDWRRLISKLIHAPEIPSNFGDLARCRHNSPCSLTGSSNPNDGKGVETAYIIPPTLVADPDMIPQSAPLYSLLQSFLTAPKVSDLREMLFDESHKARLRNMWLLSPSLHSAFRNGHIRIRPKMKVKWEEGDEIDVADASEARYTATKSFPGEFNDLYFGDGSHYGRNIHQFTLRTNDPENLPLPSAFLLRIHCRFSTALNLFSIEDQIARGWPRQPSVLLDRKAQQNIRTMWLLVPRFVRELCYRALLKAGRYLYPSEGSELVRRVPFGLYIKECSRSQENEPTSLDMVHKYTSVPAPLLVDTFRKHGDIFMVMTRVRGRALIDVFHLMSYEERDQFADDLGDYVAQLHSIPNHTPYLFADTNGGRMVDHRVPDQEFGPFNSEADFNNHLYHIGVSQKLKESIALVHSRTHRSYFTHSDLHPTNILVEGGKLSGIIDWECGAFKPEYWEFTKAMYGVWNLKPMEDMLRRAFGHQYEEELEVEQALWKVTPFGI